MRYHGHCALDGVDGELQHGSLTAVAGANGAGKGALLKAMLGLALLAAGIAELHLPRERIAYLPQQSEIERGVPMIARDAAGMAALARAPISVLSAGQFQRLPFARLIVQDAQLMLLDDLALMRYNVDQLARGMQGK